eukprot:13100222-Alexandrium_andersonii.AAC.1
MGLSAQNDADPPRTRPSGVEFEATFGAAQFKFRTPEAISHVPISLGARTPIAKDCADCRLADCGSERAISRFCGFGS